MRHPDTNPISHSPIAQFARANVRDPKRQKTFPPSSATARFIAVLDTRFRPTSEHACAFRETRNRRTNNRSAWNTGERSGPFEATGLTRPDVPWFERLVWARYYVHTLYPSQAAGRPLPHAPESCLFAGIRRR
ncbi:protein of unknown function [Burkholderia multivorans]